MSVPARTLRPWLSNDAETIRNFDRNEPPAMTVDELLSSALSDAQPPSDLSAELESLWHTKAGNWDTAHDIAQDIQTSMGSWIHALLHLIEGDIGNAGYWFNRSGKPTRTTDQIDSLWNEIATELLA